MVTSSICGDQTLAERQQFRTSDSRKWINASGSLVQYCLTCIGRQWPYFPWWCPWQSYNCLNWSKTCSSKLKLWPRNLKVITLLRRVISKEDLARFKSADAKLLPMQRRMAALDRMAAELGDSQARQPKGIMERAERDFSRQSLGASSGQLAQLAAHHVHLERYHASEPEQQAQWSMSVQPAPHVSHELHVSQPDGGHSILTRK